MIQRIQYDNEIDLFDKAFTKLSNKKDSLVSQVKFYSIMSVSLEINININRKQSERRMKLK